MMNNLSIPRSYVNDTLPARTSELKHVHSPGNLISKFPVFGSLITLIGDDVKVMTKPIIC